MSKPGRPKVFSDEEVHERHLESNRKYRQNEDVKKRRSLQARKSKLIKLIERHKMNNYSKRAPKYTLNELVTELLEINSKLEND